MIISMNFIKSLQHEVAPYAFWAILFPSYSVLHRPHGSRSMKPWRRRRGLKNTELGWIEGTKLSGSETEQEDKRTNEVSDDERCLQNRTCTVELRSKANTQLTPMFVFSAKWGRCRSTMASVVLPTNTGVHYLELLRAERWAMTVIVMMTAKWQDIPAIYK